MSDTPDSQEENIKTDKEKHEERPTGAAEQKQQQTDPQLTELKGLVDPDEPLEVKGTDNRV